MRGRKGKGAREVEEWHGGGGGMPGRKEGERRSNQLLSRRHTRSQILTLIVGTRTVYLTIIMMLQFSTIYYFAFGPKLEDLVKVPTRAGIPDYTTLMFVLEVKGIFIFIYKVSRMRTFMWC